MWKIWRLKFGWSNLCPILFADPLGFVVVMPKAAQPVTFEQVLQADPDDWPDITAESKPEDYGFIDNRLYALDYGLPDADLVKKKRAYFRDTSPHPKITQQAEGDLGEITVIPQ